MRRTKPDTEQINYVQPVEIPCDPPWTSWVDLDPPIWNSYALLK